MTTILEESRRERVGREISKRDPADFGRKAWMQSDKTSSAWVTTCPKEHNGLNPRQFPVVVQTYFGVRRKFLRDWKVCTFGRKQEEGGSIERHNATRTGKIW